MPNATVQLFTPGAVGVWSLVVIVLVALVRAWPAIKGKVNEARQIELAAQGEIRRGEREDLGECRRRLDEMQRQIDGFAETIGDLKINLNDAIIAYRILDTEVETNLPSSTALKQARAIMSTSFAVAPSRSSQPEMKE